MPFFIVCPLVGQALIKLKYLIKFKVDDILCDKSDFGKYFDFQFNGFRKGKEYKVGAGQKEFALKSFLGSKPKISIPPNTNTYILTSSYFKIHKD
jgi:hypothetical protein